MNETIERLISWFGSIEEEAIYLFYGKQGSGKTSNAVAEILRFHRQGKPVWCNFPIRDLPVQKYEIEPAPVFYEDDPAGIFSMRDGLFVIDEAYMKLNARKWAQLQDEVFEAFMHVRKLHMTVIVIAQSWSFIDVNVRRVAKVARHFTGMGPLKTFAYTDYEVDEQGEIVKTEPVEYRTGRKGIRLLTQRTFDAYDTDELFNRAWKPKSWASAVGWRPGAAKVGTYTPPRSPTGGARPRPAAAWKPLGEWARGLAGRLGAPPHSKPLSDKAGTPVTGEGYGPEGLQKREEKKLSTPGACVPTHIGDILKTYGKS